MNNQRHTKIAIVGGGIAGLYLAWRLRKSFDKDEFIIFEKEDKFGGRILTLPLSQDETNPLPAELGAMRFTDRHVLFRNLIKAGKAFKGFSQLSFQEIECDYHTCYYLRGRILHERDFRANAIEPEKFPYLLAPAERGRTPQELVAYAVWNAANDSMLPREANRSIVEKFEATKSKLVRLLEKTLAGQWYPRRDELSPQEWDGFKDMACIPITAHSKESPTGRILPPDEKDYLHLTHIGFWNLLKHYLSDEGFNLVNDGYGFASVIANWNAGEAIRWCLEDYGPSQKFYTVKYKAGHLGMSGIVKALEEEIKERQRRSGCELRYVSYDYNRTLQKNMFALTFANDEKWTCDSLVLALPVRALREIEFTNLSQSGREKKKRLLNNSWPHRMVKVILLYDEAWWKYTPIPGGETGRVFSDIPERQLYYFGTNWLREANYNPNGQALLMAYNDSRFTGFWRPFSERARNSYWIPEELSEDCAHCFHRMNNPDSKNITHEHLAEWRLVDKITKQLKELHRYNVPAPLAAVWKDWSETGAWHTWLPHVPISPAVREMLQPLNSSHFVLSHPSKREAKTPQQVPLHICGEAFSDEQGWIEGALKTAEAIALRLGCHSWKKPTRGDFSEAGYSSYKDYMRNYLG
ncbi:MAG TPA: FAD-dependent oxidoreductase [Bacteroidota bacterium]|nr:FAD-dependent oxidoreductase [Bacteroidota bacterium]